MDPTHVEHVLVVPTAEFHRLGYFQGFNRNVARYLPELFDPRHTRFRPRPDMEQDPGFKQLIPYVIFRHRDPQGTTFLFQYTRGAGQGERRLHRQRSIGIGGHISSIDGAHFGEAYEEGMRRELAEEVVMEVTCAPRLVGLLNDDLTEVGKVHLGVVHLVELDAPHVRPREADLLDAGFQPLEQILADRSQFETWSQICLDALFAPE